MPNVNKKFQCIFYFLFFLLLLYLLPLSVNGEPGIPLKEKQMKFHVENGPVADASVNIPYYKSVSLEYEEKDYKLSSIESIILIPSEVKGPDKSDIKLDKGIGGNNNVVLIWDDMQEWFEWTADIPEDGLYEIEIEYYPLPGIGGSIQRSLTIDGKTPFMEAYNLLFPRMWRDEGEPEVNNIGDEILPRQIELTKWITTGFLDSQGMNIQNFKFYLSKGLHSIRLGYVDQPAAFGNMIIKAPQAIPSYDEVKLSYLSEGYKEAQDTIKFQAENTTVSKSDPVLRRIYNGDPKTEPFAAGYKKLNCIGGWRWRKGNQSITWKFKVVEEGLYKIMMRALQFWDDGLPSYRQILIDGKIPFKEMEAYCFTFYQDWRKETLSDESGEPYLFYLTKGEHTITLTLKLGPLSDIIQSLMENSLLISENLRKIIKLTGRNPDPNYEYELEKNIPGILDSFSLIADSMQYNAGLITEISSKKPSIANNFIMIRDQLNSMIKKPEIIARKLTDLNNAQTSIGTWILSLQERPLLIDYFIIGSPSQEYDIGKSTVFEKLYAAFQDFLRSFTKDYDSVGSKANSKSDLKILNVWVSRGKEWADIIREMADEDFTPDTGININMNILPASQLNAGGINTLQLAIISGKAPDVALGVSLESPVEFAIRDATVDLAQFSDFDQITERFYKSIMIPFKYNNGIYGLPETMDFSVLFYRKDIIDNIGIEIPDTWDEVYSDVLPLLYQNGLQFYYPPSNLASAPSITPFLFQNGGNYYSEDGKKSGLDSPAAFKAFKEWTELFANYGIPVEANFFNRMRSGEMPMGIGNYSHYIMLSVAAPELYGRWDIAPIPGKKLNDGTVNRSIGGIASQACLILKQSEKKEEAWKFLKWWTSTDVQIRFGRELESIIGIESRWNTANKEAFSGLPWDTNHRKVLLEQLKWGKEQPVVLGGYFTGRHLNNAWNSVVMGDMTVRDSLEKAIKDINTELRAKQIEYGFNPEK